MVREAEPDARNAIYSVLQTNGWIKPEIVNFKMLAEPFHNDDPVMRACFDDATKKDGGIVVYSDPIEEP
jgi:hypothetical protein